jgi:hypothetical protein
MLSRLLPVVYERWWRPAWSRLLRGGTAAGMGDEHRIARLLLGLRPGDGALDVACGPGNFTRDFAGVVRDASFDAVCCCATRSPSHWSVAGSSTCTSAWPA